MSSRGKFIVFEGIDGCGKSTQLKLASAFLFGLNKEFDVYVTREPTRNYKKIREALEHDVKDAEWFTQAFLMDRLVHVDAYINPMLEKGTHVLCDRFKHSTLAYQSVQGMDLEDLINKHKGMVIPDLTFIFDLPSEVAFERRKTEGNTDAFDKNSLFQEKVGEVYKKLPEILVGEKVVMIDSDRPMEEIAAEVWSTIEILFL
jgi:dTMP kinase